MFPDVKLQKMTVEAFLAWVETQPEGTRYELHEGEQVEMPPSKALQTTITARIIRYLGAFVDDNDAGTVTSSDGGFYISPHDFYAPDTSFYSKARLLEGIPENDYFRIPPDLAVEVVSSSDEYTAHKKAQRYIELGVKLVWVMYPKSQTIDVYTPAGDGVHVRQLKASDTLTGGDILAGFEVSVARIFGQAAKA